MSNPCSPFPCLFSSAHCSFLCHPLDSRAIVAMVNNGKTRVMVASTLLLLVLAASHVASARDFVWKEGNCNTNFNNDGNWDTGAPTLEDSGVKTTVYFGPRDGPTGDWDPVSSLVQTGEYGMSEIVFSGDGILEFQADGPELVFYPPDDTIGDTTAFIAAQGYSPECDFNCHKVSDDGKWSAGGRK